MLFTRTCVEVSVRRQRKAKGILAGSSAWADVVQANSGVRGKCLVEWQEAKLSTG